MQEYWDKRFAEIEMMWGHEPADSALYAMGYFKTRKISKILIPGIGYGRNAAVFCENGFDVTGIEISGYAIEMAKNKPGLDIKIHHGSVTEMPFDNELYDGIYCYALLHLLNINERRRFLENCYRQLAPGGVMIFVVVSKKAVIYGKGKKLSTERYQISPGLNVYFYDIESARKEFAKFGPDEVVEFDEPIKFNKDEPPLKMILIRCSWNRRL
jgi:SAM-dependent methyltransferase